MFKDRDRMRIEDKNRWERRKMLVKDRKYFVSEQLRYKWQRRGGKGVGSEDGGEAGRKVTRKEGKEYLILYLIVRRSYFSCIRLVRK